MTMTPEEMQAVLGQMIRDNQRMSGVLNRAADQFSNTIDKTEGDRQRAQRRLDRDTTRANVNVATQRFANTVQQLTTDADSFSRAVDSFVNKLIGGAAINAVIHQIRALSDTYQSLTEVGQTFSGSMFEMARQAGAAGLSLSDFAKVISTASNAAAVLGRNGQGGLPMLALEVRKNIREFGNYGYSLEQVLELTGEYAETLRLQGQLDDSQRAQAGRSITALAEDIATFSIVTGKSRREIAQASQAALRDVAVTSRATLGMSEVQRRGMDQATAFLASIPGDAGQFLSTFFAQSIGYGSALYTDATQTLVQAGFSQGVSLMDRAQQRIAAGLDEGGEAMREFAADFVQEADANLHGLRTQAMAGNENAKRVLEIARQMRVVSNMSAREIERMRQQARQREALTQFATTFNDIFSEIMGAFKEGFYAQLVEVTRSLQSFISQGGIKSMADRFKTLGERVGGLIARILTPQNIQTFADRVEQFVSGFVTFVSTLLDTWTAKGLATAVGGFVEGILAATGIVLALVSAVGTLVSGINWLLNAIGQGIAWIAGLFGRDWNGDAIGAFFTALIGTGAALVAGFVALVAATAAVVNAFKTAGNLIRGQSGQVQVPGGGGGQGGNNGRGGPAGPSNGGSGGGRGARIAAVAGSIGAAALGVVGAEGLIPERFRGQAAAPNADGNRPAAAQQPAADPARPNASPAQPAAEPARPAGQGAPDPRPNATMPDGRQNPWHQAAPAEAARPAGEAAPRRPGIGERLRNAARAGGRGIARAAPFGVGLALGGASSAALAGDGDYVGAALEGASTAAGVVPGFGTAASLGLSGLSMLREVVGRDTFDSSVGNFVMRQMGSQTREAQAQAEHSREMDQEMARLQGGVQRELDNLARQLEQQRTEARQSREVEQETQRLMREQTELLRLQNALTGGLGRQQLDAARQQLRAMQTE